MDAQSQDDKKWETFRQQIRDDISQIQDIVSWDTRTKEESFAFNYWILAKLYDEDENAAFNQITDYSDEGIDCFVHDEEGKHLYIIQNKYYSDGVGLKSRDLSDFLKRPLANLRSGNYKNRELQEAFNKAKVDDEYTIHLHLYVTNNDDLSKGCETLIKDAKSDEFKFELFRLKGIHELYYGKSFSKQRKLEHIFSTTNSSTYMAIRPKDYQLKGMYQTFFVMTPLTDIYRLWEAAEGKEYSLFETNIREYLGKRTPVNRQAIETLKNEKERKNFFYYNNGITIICDDVNQVKGMKEGSIRVKQPQVINGCQTVNSIVEVLRGVDPQQRDEFDEIFVMTKIISTNEKTFSGHVVEYTNSQNAINEKALAVGREEKFTRLQKEIEKLGFLLVVRQSDKNSFSEKYKGAELQKQLDRANNYLPEMELNIKSLAGLQIALEHLLQCLGALSKDAHFAYTKKAQVLKPSSKTYREFSVNIHTDFTVEEMAKTICLYKKAEQDKKQNKEEESEKRFPASYYLINFFGALLREKGDGNLERLRDLDSIQVRKLYDFVKPLSKRYFSRSHHTEYGLMIKSPVDTGIFNEVLKNKLEDTREDDRSKYEEIIRILSPQS